MNRREVFRVEFQGRSNGAPLPLRDHPEVAVLRFSQEENPGAWAEVCFPDPATIRWRGRGCRLRLVGEPADYHYARPAGNDRWEFNFLNSRTQFMVTRVEGGMEVDAPWEQHSCRQLIISAIPETPDGVWEFTLEEFTGEWSPTHLRESSEETMEVIEREFQAWDRQLPPAAGSLAEARQLASYIAWVSLVKPSGHLRREAMLMSKNWMVNIWSWDHCFNALALVPGHGPMAWDQWAVAFDHQHSGGMLPDCQNDREIIWNFTKPPVHGWALGEMIRRGFVPTTAQCRQAIRWLERWTDWWLRCRDEDRDGIPQYNHGNDSGWDNSTLFAAGMPVEGPDLATFLVLQMETLADLHECLQHRVVAARWRARAADLVRKLLAHSWDPGTGRFLGRRSGDHVTAEGDSLVAFLPLLLGRHLPEEVRHRLVDGLAEPGRFLTAHGLATESLRSPHYRPAGYWRGPIWAPATLLIIRGLQACGAHVLAREVAERFCITFARSGSAENFDALTGAGQCDRAYTWTASVFLVLAEELARNDPITQVELSDPRHWEA